MSLVLGLVFAHLKPTIGALDLKEYNMKSCTVLLFLLAELCFFCLHSVEGTRIRPNYEVEQLEEKMSHLKHIFSIYEQLESQGFIDPTLGVAEYETMEYALFGSLINIMNYKSTPRQLVNIKDKVVEKLDRNGLFSVFVVFHSLANGNEYYHLEGDIDMNTLKLNIRIQKKISSSEFKEIKMTTPSFFDGWYQKVGYESSGFNNGSKGGENLLYWCFSVGLICSLG